MVLPKDPFILLSFINTKLRDYYENLDKLCEDMEINKDKLCDELKSAGFEYSCEENRFC